MLEAHVDTRDVERGLAGLLRAGQDISPVLREMQPHVRSDLAEHQRQQLGPESRWAPPAAGTRRRQGRTKSGRRRRRRPLGRLPRAYTMRVVGGDALVIRSRVRWAGVQQEGGRAGRGAMIPARPFLYFGKEVADDFTAATRAYLARGWGRG